MGGSATAAAAAAEEEVKEFGVSGSLRAAASAGMSCFMKLMNSNEADEVTDDDADDEVVDDASSPADSAPLVVASINPSLTPTSFLNAGTS
jgi:hypothetical protein